MHIHPMHPYWWSPSPGADEDVQQLGPHTRLKGLKYDAVILEDSLLQSFWDQFFSSIVWVPGIELRSSSLITSAFNLTDPSN